MQFGKLRYLDAMLLRAVLTGLYKAANPEALFIFLTTDWLKTQEQILASVVEPRWCPLCMLMHIKV